MQVEFDRKLLSMFFESIISLTGEGMLHIKKDYMIFTSVDAANVALISAKFYQSFPEEVDIAVDILKLKSTINAITSKKVTLTIGKDIHIKGGKVERDVRSLTEATLKKEPSLPTLQFPVVIEVPNVDFIEIIEAIDKMGTSEGSLPIAICFEYDGKNLVIHCENDIKEITKSEFDTISTEKGKGEKHKSYFSFDYILDITKTLKKLNSDNIVVSIGTNIPFKIEIKNEIMEICWFLAPRVEKE